MTLITHRRISYYCTLSLATKNILQVGIGADRLLGLGPMGKPGVFCRAVRTPNFEELRTSSCRCLTGRYVPGGVATIGGDWEHGLEAIPRHDWILNIG